MKKLIITSLLVMASQPLVAAGLINEMQSCQALISFIGNKLNDVPSSYDPSDVEKIKKGLKAYDQYIQREIVSPGLLQFNSGDQAKADQMQKQVNVYKDGLIKQLETRYPANRLFTDQAIAVNNCAKKAVPKGQALEDLKEALNMIIKLAKIGQ